MSTYHDRLSTLRGQSSLRAAVRGVRGRVAEMLAAHRTRRLLAEMDVRMLKDIGMSPGDALVEAGRPMWDVR